MKTIDYVIISAVSLDELQGKIQKFQGDGEGVEWYPSGSPVFHKDQSGTWHQAMYGVSASENSAA